MNILKLVGTCILFPVLTASCDREPKPEQSSLKFGYVNIYLNAVRSACSGGSAKSFGQCISKVTRDQLTKYHHPATITGQAPLVSSEIRERILKYTKEVSPEHLDQLKSLSQADVNQHLNLMESVLNKHPSPSNHGVVSNQTLFRIDSRSPDQWGGLAYMSPNLEKRKPADILPKTHLTSGGTSTWISVSGSMQTHPSNTGVEALSLEEKAAFIGKSNLDMLDDPYFLPEASICFVNFGSASRPNLRLCNTIGETTRDKFLVFVTNQYIAREHSAFVPKGIVSPDQWEALTMAFQPDSYRKVIGTAHVVGNNVEWTGAFVNPEQPIEYQYIEGDPPLDELHDKKFSSILDKGFMGRWDASLGRPMPFHMVVAATLCGLRIQKNICCKNFTINR